MNFDVDVINHFSATINHLKVYNGLKIKMSCEFAFLFRRSGINKRSVFRAHDEEYNASITFAPVTKFSLKWTRPSNIIVCVHVSEDYKTFIFRRRSVARNSTEILISCSNNPNLFLFYKTYTCTINIIPVVSYELPSLRQSPLHVPNVRKNTDEIPENKVVVTKFQRLYEDFRDVLASGNFCDVILKLDSTEFRAHRAILSSRSPVFAKMFRNKMQENFENSIIINDVLPEVMEAFLNFVYTGVASITNKKMARDLYVVADKYDVKDLKDICCDILKNVVLDDVIDVLIMSELYGDEILKKSALDFIAKQYSDVKSHPSWEKLVTGDQKILIEVLNYIIETNVQN